MANDQIFQSRRNAKFRVPSAGEFERIRKGAGDAFQLPQGYPQELAEFAALYRTTDRIPDAGDRVYLRPNNDHFRAFPLKYRRAISYASPDARLVFLALWDRHEARNSRANGLIAATLDLLQEWTAIGRRINVNLAIIELEVRGIVRVLRGRGGSGKAHPNMFLLTGFADALGNPPTCDYEQLGLPAEKPTANSDEARGEQAKEIASRFNARIKLQVELTRILRNAKERLQ